MYAYSLLKSALAALSALFGGIGVFCVIYSFSLPLLAPEALLMLGAALAITYLVEA